MKLNFRNTLLPLLALVILFSSCSKSNKQGKWIPKDALMAFVINGKSLNEKLPWEEIKKNPLFVEAYSDSSLPEFSKRILDNPENSGIDNKNDLIIYIQRDSLGTLVVAEGTLKDEAKFKQLNLDASKGAAVTEKDGISFISRDKVTVGWKKDKFVYVAGGPQMSMPRRYGADYDRPVPDRDMIVACKAAFDLSEGASLTKDDHFTSLMNQEGDLYFWLNTEQMYKGASFAEDNMSMLSKFYEGNVTTASVSFNNGKANIKYTSYVGGEMKKICKKYSGGKIDEDMLKRIPSKEVAAVFAMHFKPQGIKELIELTGMESMINMAMVFVGFSIDDFIKANKGDVLFAVTGYKPGTDKPVVDTSGGKMTFSIDRPKPEFLFAAAIGDKDAFNMLIRAAKKMSKQEGIADDNQLAYNSNADYFVLSNTKEMVDPYLGNTKNDHAFISKISGSPMGGYVNLQYLMKMIPQNEIDSSNRLIYDVSLKTWDDIVMSGGDFSDGGFTYNVDINMMDKNTNSLKQLNNYFGQIAPSIIEKKRKEDADRKVVDEMMKKMKTVDQTVVAPPPPNRSVKK